MINSNNNKALVCGIGKFLEHKICLLWKKVIMFVILSQSPSLLFKKNNHFFCASLFDVLLYNALLLHSNVYYVLCCVAFGMLILP